MKSKLSCKILAVGIIVLFMGVSVSSSVSISNESNLIEIPISIHTSNGIQRYTLELTESQHKELDRTFTELQADLLNCDSDLEVSEVYNIALQSLYINGLFPDCLSVEETQDLFLRFNILPRLQIVLSHLFSFLAVKQVFNLLCYVSGQSDDTDIFLGIIFYGGYEEYGWAYEANGWIYTFGLFGEQYFEGIFNGEITYTPAPTPDSPYKRVGGIGFRGLALTIDDITYYFGIAKWIWIKELESNV